MKAMQLAALLMLCAAPAPLAAQDAGDGPAAASPSSAPSPVDGPATSSAVRRAEPGFDRWRAALPASGVRAAVLRPAPPRPSNAPHTGAVAGAVAGGALGLFVGVVLDQESTEVPPNTVATVGLLGVLGAVAGGLGGYALGKVYALTHRPGMPRDPATRHPWGLDRRRGASPGEGTAAAPAGSAIPAGV